MSLSAEEEKLCWSVTLISFCRQVGCLLRLVGLVLYLVSWSQRKFTPYSTPCGKSLRWVHGIVYLSFWCGIIFPNISIYKVVTALELTTRFTDNFRCYMKIMSTTCISRKMNSKTFIRQYESKDWVLFHTLTFLFKEFPPPSSAMTPEATRQRWQQGNKTSYLGCIIPILSHSGYISFYCYLRASWYLNVIFVILRTCCVVLWGSKLCNKWELF